MLTTLAGGRTRALAAAGQPAAEALTGGFRMAFGVAAGLLTVALLLAAVVLRTPEVD